ncbi:aspartate/glutamate racemase family protein [Variovorax sp. VNK109]|uniref:aspartate/glutamate racemase family protein n=1 Tax=Variovorax sp. VNK109 TaxID=3400919 RepID=UPI003C0948A9
MNLLVLNPNSSPGMTAQAVDAVHHVTGDRVQARGVTAIQGPPVVASRESFVAGAWAALETLKAERPSDGAVLLACFGDPGLAALREVSDVPVVGMAESALLEAATIGKPFHILTAGLAWDAMLRETVRLHGCEPLLDGVTVLDTTGLSISADPQAHAQRVQAALDGIAARGQPTCILGGTGFASMAGTLRYGGVLIDGLAAAARRALRLAEAAEAR